MESEKKRRQMSSVYNSYRAARSEYSIDQIPLPESGECVGGVSVWLGQILLVFNFLFIYTQMPVFYRLTFQCLVSQGKPILPAFYTITTTTPHTVLLARLCPPGWFPRGHPLDHHHQTYPTTMSLSKRKGVYDLLLTAKESLTTNQNPALTVILRNLLDRHLEPRPP